MNSKIALAMSALAVLGMTGTANAFSFSPTSTHFSAKGTLQLSALGTTISCKSTLAGMTKASGMASISRATFTGASPICGLITPEGLPWKMKAKNATTATLANVMVGGGGSSCGPSNVTVAVSSSGVITFTNAQLSGGCTINGPLQTAPVIKIVNP